MYFVYFVGARPRRNSLARVLWTRARANARIDPRTFQSLLIVHGTSGKMHVNAKGFVAPLANAYFRSQPQHPTNASEREHGNSFVRRFFALRLARPFVFHPPSSLKTVTSVNSLREVRQNFETTRRFDPCVVRGLSLSTSTSEVAAGDAGCFGQN